MSSERILILNNLIKKQKSSHRPQRSSPPQTNECSLIKRNSDAMETGVKFFRLFTILSPVFSLSPISRWFHSCMLSSSSKNLTSKWEHICFMLLSSSRWLDINLCFKYYRESLSSQTCYTTMHSQSPSLFLALSLTLSYTVTQSYF